MKFGSVEISENRKPFTYPFYFKEVGYHIPASFLIKKIIELFLIALKTYSYIILNIKNRDNAKF